MVANLTGVEGARLLTGVARVIADLATVVITAVGCETGIISNLAGITVAIRYYACNSRCIA
jgi:hypothetical protein